MKDEEVTQDDIEKSVLFACKRYIDHHAVKEAVKNVSDTESLIVAALLSGMGTCASILAQYDGSPIVTPGNLTAAIYSAAKKLKLKDKGR